MAQQSQQEGLERLDREYYDIMLVGKTGQGKSTMADKLLIANPEGKKYVPEMTKPTTRQGGGVRVILEDISMWLLHEDDENQDIETHLKGLVHFRTTPEPHSGVNKMRDPKKNILTGTSSCQIFSNDTTKLRILDVPGFQDEKAFRTPTSPTASSLNAPCQAAVNIATFDMGTMRNVIRIQSALGMHFRRVVYFLPSRGVLERPDSGLKLDLQQLEYAFGRSVFDCMVAVATISRRPSLKKEDDEEKFPREDIEQCQEHFQKALTDVLGIQPNQQVPKVPIIFVSLAESCESILGKVKGAQVSCDHLELRFNPSTCANCGVKIGSWDGKRITCSTLQDPNGSIPYEESKCHPAFKRSILSYVLGRTIAKKISRRWPAYKDESCVGCKQRPFEPGCLQIGQKHSTWWRVYFVDHTSEVTEPVDEPPPQADQSEAAARDPPHQDDQSGDANQPAPPDTHQEVRADQYAVGGTVLQIPTEEGGRQNILVQAGPRVTTSVNERKGT